MIGTCAYTVYVHVQLFTEILLLEKLYMYLVATSTARFLLDHVSVPSNMHTCY
jgi:hypothetical protein